MKVLMMLIGSSFVALALVGCSEAEPLNADQEHAVDEEVFPEGPIRTPEWFAEHWGTREIVMKTCWADRQKYADAPNCQAAHDAARVRRMKSSN